MLKRVLPLLNIKPNEAHLVKQLFLVQFVLGVATAFLYTGSLTLFLSAFAINDLPKVFIISALLILFFNKVYAYYEEKLSPSKLLQIVVLFSMVSTLLFWIALKAYAALWLIMLLAAWNVLIYMLIGYAFWGLAALHFNVRESKRVFSVVGSGDIPAKMLGYVFVSILVHVIGIINLLWIPIGSLACCWLVLKRPGMQMEHGSHVQQHNHHSIAHKKTSYIGDKLLQVFQSKLVLFIALVSLIAYTIFLFVDFTFLAEIKLKYKEQKELAAFVAVFFAGGRVFAILIKVLLSSRMISKIGLLNSLMITPILLLVINAFVILFGGKAGAPLYLFGAMVLLIEILRSTVQEPVFFVLFQPLNPHDRLKGHLVAKGYTFPVALLAVGIFLLFYLQSRADVSIMFLSKAMFLFLFLWVGAVFLVRHEYMQTLINSLRRGYFTGAELFLNDEAVSEILIQKSNSSNPLEVIHALNLLERSCHPDAFKLLLDHLKNNPSTRVKEYVLERVISNHMSSALPIIKKQISTAEFNSPSLYKALYYLDTSDKASWENSISRLDQKNTKAALSGLSLKKDEDAAAFVLEQVDSFSFSNDPAEVKLALEMIEEQPAIAFVRIIERLSEHPSQEIRRMAIETGGKLQERQLFTTLVTACIAMKAFYSFERMLVNYGDIAFEDDMVPSITFPAKIHNHIIKAAARIKGPNSDKYLVKIFLDGGRGTDRIIDAMWRKKAGINHISDKIENWAMTQLENMRIKVNCFAGLHHNKPAQMLERALMSEVQQDVETVLKAFSLLYNSDQIDQFIEVYNTDNTTRVANGIELLEMTIPKKYFSLLIYFIDLTHDLKRQEHVHQKKPIDVYEVIHQVAGSEKNIFDYWSQSLAVYLSPRILSKEAALSIARNISADEETLLKETKQYVLSILK